MKKIILLTALTFQAIFLSAQSLGITGDDFVTGDATIEIVSYLTVTNNSAQSLDVICAKNVISQPQDGDNYFCWGGACYSSSTMISPDFTTIAPGQSTTEFQGHFSSLSEPAATAVVEYCFYPNTDPSDVTCLTVTYDGAGNTSIEENTSHIISDFYPNPTKEVVYIDYFSHNSSTLILMDILGNELKKIELLGRGSRTINISDLPKGIYIGNVVLNNKVLSTKKLIVR